MTLKHKIVLIALVATLGFSINGAVSFYTGRLNQAQIKSVRLVKFPVLEKLGQIRNIITDVKGGLGAALREDDEFIIEELMNGLSEKRAALNSILKSIKTIDPSSGAQTDHIADVFSRYFSLSTKVVKTISGLSDDVEDLQVSFQKMHELEEELNQEIIKFRKLRFDEFEGALSHSEELSFSAVEKGLWLGGITIVAVLIAGFSIASMISRKIVQVSKSLETLAGGAGDLTFRIEKDGSDELTELVGHFNYFVSHLQELILRLAEGAGLLGCDSRMLDHIADQTKSSCLRQREKVTQSVAITHQLVVAAQDISATAEVAFSLTKRGLSETEVSQAAVNENMTSIDRLAQGITSAQEVIDRLSEDSKKITGIMKVLRTIADQTNLLALNAAIEAARAGEAGRGFAVVADEVRSLAEKTAEYTTDIQKFVESIRASSEQAVTVMEDAKQRAALSVTQSRETGTSLDAIAELIKQLNATNAQVATASMQQDSLIKELNSHIEVINGDVSTTVDMVGQTADASGAVAREAANQQRVIDNFKLS